MVEMGSSQLADGVQTGRIARRRDVENEEIQMYLSKLKDLVPFMPKNRKLSKLEVIRHVIEYICELQYALESHPASVTVDSGDLVRLGGDAGRQPLGTLAPSPNTHNTHPATATATAAESSSRSVCIQYTSLHCGVGC